MRRHVARRAFAGASALLAGGPAGRLLPLALAGLALAVVARAARSGEEDQLRWGLAPGEAVRYDLEEDAGKAADSSGAAAVFAHSQIVTDSDFADRRRPKLPVADYGELTWWFILEAPAGEFGKKGGEIAINEKFALPGANDKWKPGSIVAKGKEVVSRKGADLVLKTTLELTNEGATTPSCEPGSTLVVERVWLEKKKLVKDASFRIELKRKSGEKLQTFRTEGRVACLGKLDFAGKSMLKDVQGAINRGSRYLLAELNKRLGSYKGMKDQPSQGLGYIALPTFALLRSGVPLAHLRDAFDYMSRCEFRETYSVALYVMALEAKTVRRDEVAPQQGGHTVARFVKAPTPAADKAEMSRAIRWLIATRWKGHGTWSYKGNPGKDWDKPQGEGTRERAAGGADGTDGGPVGEDGKPITGGDRSNSQFAVLALQCGATSEIPIPEVVWREIATEIVSAQEADGPNQTIQDVEWTAAAPPGLAPEPAANPFGPPVTREKGNATRERPIAKARGWAYGMGSPGQAYGSMTGAGLSSIVIAREGLRRLNKLDSKLDGDTLVSAQDGVAWFNKNWSPTSNHPNGKGWMFFYYLYSVEKAMEIAGVEKLGAREWWREGAAELLSLENRRTGGFALKGDANPEDTAFALLFLNRATLPAKIVSEDSIRIATGDKNELEAWDQVFVEGTGHVRLRQVLYAIETATPDLVASRLKIAEKGFDVLEEERRPRLVPDLLRLLGSPDRNVKRFVQRALRVATGTEEEGRARSFHARWSELARACETQDYDRIPQIRAFLKQDEATTPFPLKRCACLALARLRAVEATTDILPLLEDKDPMVRRFAATALVQLVGPKAEFDASASDADRARQAGAWRAWWQKEGAQVVFEEEARRDVERLAGSDAAAAEARLRQKGKRAARVLVDGLRNERTREKCRTLLEAATGERLGNDPEAWLAWLGKQGKDG